MLFFPRKLVQKLSARCNRIQNQNYICGTHNSLPLEPAQMATKQVLAQHDNNTLLSVFDYKSSSKDKLYYVCTKLAATSRITCFLCFGESQALQHKLVKWLVYVWATIPFAIAAELFDKCTISNMQLTVWRMTCCGPQTAIKCCLRVMTMDIKCK